MGPRFAIRCHDQEVYSSALGRGLSEVLEPSDGLSVSAGAVRFKSARPNKPSPWGTAAGGGGEAIFMSRERSMSERSCFTFPLKRPRIRLGVGLFSSLLSDAISIASVIAALNKRGFVSLSYQNYTSPALQRQNRDSRIGVTDLCHSFAWTFEYVLERHWLQSSRSALLSDQGGNAGCVGNPERPPRRQSDAPPRSNQHQVNLRATCRATICFNTRTRKQPDRPLWPTLRWRAFKRQSPFRCRRLSIRT